MRALVLTEPGDPPGLEVTGLPVPTPGPGQVLIEVAACGLNPVDASLAGSRHPAWAERHVLGLDVAGTILAGGSGVHRLRVGDRVVVHTDLRAEGGLAELCVADAAAVARLPDSVAFVDAAALPCAGMTAYESVVRRLRVGPADSVLVTGGNGGVGGFAVQLAALAGARVIATASSDHARVHALGASIVIDHRSPDAFDQVVAAAGRRGIDAVVNTVSAGSATDQLALLNHGGGIACIAGRAELANVEPFGVAPSVHEIALGAAYSHGGEEARRRLRTMLAALLELVDRRRLDPMVRRVVGLDEAAEALRSVGDRHGRGKTVVRVGSPEPGIDTRPAERAAVMAHDDKSEVS